MALPYTFSIELQLSSATFWCVRILRIHCLIRVFLKRSREYILHACMHGVSLSGVD